MGVRRDDYLVLGVCYVEGGAEGDSVEDSAAESGGGRYDVIMNNKINSLSKHFGVLERTQMKCFEHSLPF